MVLQCRRGEGGGWLQVSPHGCSVGGGRGGGGCR